MDKENLKYHQQSFQHYQVRLVDLLHQMQIQKKVMLMQLPKYTKKQALFHSKTF